MKKPRAAQPDEQQNRHEKIRAAIQQCEDQNGHVEPVRVWKAARDPSHPLHDEFDWNVRRAAEAHWTETAKGLIRIVRSIVQYEDERIAVPHYVHDPRTVLKYIPTGRIATNGDVVDRVMRDELDRIEKAIGRARSLAIAFNADTEFSEMLSAVTRLRRMFGQSAAAH
jgi:hypothetical protein